MGEWPEVDDSDVREPYGFGMNEDEERAQQEEYVLRALERAQNVARGRGLMRRSLPTWGLEEGNRRSAGRSPRSDEVRVVDGHSGEDESTDAQLDGGLVDISALRDVDPEGDLTSVRSAAQSARSHWTRSTGMAPMRTRYRSVGKLGSILGRIVRAQQWDTPTKMGSIMVKWPDIVGQTVAQHCRIETFDNHKLIVRCSSTAWAKQLQLLLPTIERRIAEEVGPGVVHQVVVRGPVAPDWKKGPWSVRGRGPRDTYG
ncbi:DciA family protein [Schaalia sp. ZJ1691]|uniref:DUF721 domain-containing protein n=1 Tax=Schaalia sp. ZJ1691 TaxID=2709404 RepID=UPI001F14F494|nr:DciA family protein [Schaalia sp. ZJ1691]